MAAPPPDVAAYLSGVPVAHRKALLALRQQVLALAPEATERISYGLPAFFHDGSLVWMGSFTRHCSLFAGYTGARIARESASPSAKVVGSTIQFAADKPLPATLVQRIVKARLAENRARARAKASGGAGRPPRKRTAKAA